jgi:predicted dehydrogenase
MAQAIQYSETSKLVAIGSRDLTRAIEFAKKHNINKFYSDYNELLKDDEVEIIYIGLPNHLHAKWVKQCALHGKHILCEKPFALNANEAKEALEVVKKYNVFCMEALMYQCHPFISHLENIIESKIIGDIQYINAIYNVNIVADENPIAGGAIRCLGCYPTSLTLLLLGDESPSILGVGQINKVSRNDNVSSVICSFKNGITATIATSDTLDWHSQFTIFGSNGTINIDTNPWLPTESNKLTIKVPGKQIETIEIKAKKPLYSYQIDCVADHILNQLTSPKRERNGVTWEHTLQNITLLENWISEVKNRADQAEILESCKDQ